jgi:hypothetical protein
MLRFLAAIALLLTCATTTYARKPVWLAVGPAEFLKAIAPLVEHRQADGMETVLSSDSPDRALAALAKLPDFLLLVGDEAPNAAGKPWHVPTQRRPFNGWQGVHRPDFASDFAWGGLDSRGVPLIPTGRLPVRTAAEAGALAKKIVAWEQQPMGSLSLPMWAGDPLYAPEYTERFMNFLFGQVQKNAPAWLEPWVLSGDSRHSLAGPFELQARLFNDRTSRGAIFTGMIGHGLPDSFLSLRLGQRRIGYTVADARALQEGAPRPPHVIFACQSGMFTLPEKRCLAEELVLAPAGPVLCIAATEDSHPLPNFYTATSLLQKVREAEGSGRFGSLWLDAQRAARRRHDTLIEFLVRDAEGRLNKGRAEVDLLKLDQASLYAILGDPATRFHMPQKLQARTVKTERGWTWEVTPPPGATRLRVETRSDSPNFPNRPGGVDESKLAGVFEAAVDLLQFKPLATLAAGQPWRGEVTAPAIVRLIAETASGLYVAGFELR